MATSLEEAGEELLRFFGFPESQHLSLRTTNAIERMQLRLFFGLWVSGQIKLRRIRGYRDIGGQQEEAA